MVVQGIERRFISCLTIVFIFLGLIWLILARSN